MLAMPQVGIKAEERINVEHDTRMVSDIGSLDIPMISALTGQIWIFAKVTPDTKDGQFTGVSRNPATGIYTQIPGQLVTQVWKGTIKTFAPIVGTAEQQVWNYEWHLPAAIYQQYLVSNSGTADPYLAFYGKNAIVCRIIGGSSTTTAETLYAKFYPIYLVPSQWEAYVVPALSYLHDNAGVFQSKNAVKNADLWWKLTEDANPIVATQALRVLHQGTAVDETRLYKLLTGTTGLKQAVFTCVVLGLKPPQSTLLSESRLSELRISESSRPSFAVQQGVNDAINKIIQGAKSSTELEGIAWGIWAAAAAPTTRRGRDGTAKLRRIELLETFLEGIQKKQNTFHSHTHADSRLYTWLRAANIPQ